MALMQEYTKDNVIFYNAYHKLSYIETDHTDKLIVCLEIFPNKTLRDVNRGLLETKVFYTPNEEGDNKTEIAYNYIKTMPEYSAAQDV